MTTHHLRYAGTTTTWGEWDDMWDAATQAAIEANKSRRDVEIVDSRGKVCGAADFRHRIKTMTPEPGIYYGIPFADYQRWDAINPSKLKLLISDSPKAMWWAALHGKETTGAMELGGAVHAAVLEPDTFDSRFAFYPGPVRRGKSYDEFCDANPGKVVLTIGDRHNCGLIAEAVRGHASSAELISGDGAAEVSVVWRDKGTGLMCKGRIDWLPRDCSRLVDLKTTRDPKPMAFTRQSYNLLYHVSLAAYMVGLSQFVDAPGSAHIIAVGNQPPHDCIRYDLGDALIRRGRDEWHTGLQRAKWCMDHNDWPGFAAEPYPLELPSWAVTDDEADAMSMVEAATTE